MPSPAIELSPVKEAARGVFERGFKASGGLYIGRVACDGTVFPPKVVTYAVSQGEAGGRAVRVNTINTISPQDAVFAIVDDSEATSHASQVVIDLICQINTEFHNG